jgi:hypothetical protein
MKRNYIRNTVFLLLSLVILAFVAPIPSSRAAEEVEILWSANENSLCPKIGPFYSEDSFEHDGVRMKLIVSGKVYMENDAYFAEYDEIFVTLDDTDQEIAREVHHVTREYPVIQMNEEKSRDTKILADYYGEFQYYLWNNMKMIQYPGSLQQGIAYEHPDNYYYYLYYPQLWNLPWYRHVGYGYMMHHISQTQINEALATSSFTAIASTIAVGISKILLIYYGISIVAAALSIKIVIALLALLAIYAALFAWWVSYVLTTEQGDGWSYTYWNGWFLQASYGGWKNIWVISW